MSARQNPVDAFSRLGSGGSDEIAGQSDVAPDTAVQPAAVESGGGAGAAGVDREDRKAGGPGTAFGCNWQLLVERLHQVPERN